MKEHQPSYRVTRSLSARLLALTIAFVMVAEVLIYVPSISRFRKVYLEDRLAKAHLAILAVEANPDQAVTARLQKDLLSHADAYAIVLKEPERRMLMLGEKMPPAVDATFNLDDTVAMDWISEALSALVRTDNRVLRVIGPSPRRPEATVEVLIDEAPLRAAMQAFSVRILTLSIIISLITAGLVYFSLRWLMVRPILKLVEGMVRFRDNPEDPALAMQPSGRKDEIGAAEHELASMQAQIRAALRQKTRLAALGAAVAKINHDLRNSLATAVLASDRLSEIDDPEVQRLAPRLYKSIDKAVALCARSLDFLREDGLVLRPTRFRFHELIEELRASYQRTDADGPGLDRIDARGGDLAVEADRELLFRTFGNLINNAQQAGARSVAIIFEPTESRLRVDVIDDGPGIPDTVRAHLFQPFVAAGRDGGTGLGLVIAREIIAAHGGDLSLVATSPEGTTFRIELPLTKTAKGGRR